MTIDLTGGLDEAREYVFPECPAEDGMRDAVNMWVSDDRGEIGIPRFAVEAAAPDWDEHGLQLNLGFPDGRVFRIRQDYPSLPTAGPDARSSVFGAGPLVFRCVEPFTTWTATFRGDAVQTSTKNLIAGDYDGPRVPLEFEVEARMAVPPWIQGTMQRDAGDLLAGSVEGKLMGGPRYEQLFRATGAVRVGGESHTFTGTGLRIRRQGVRDISEFWGHAWQSALFPSGRAFGYITYPPRAGKPTYNEAYLFTGDGDLVPARVVEAPWLRKLQGNGEDVSVVLESELGRTRIEGETVVSTYDVAKPDMPRFPVLQQANVRFRWDGEETYGMLERSSMRDRITW